MDLGVALRTLTFVKLHGITKLQTPMVTTVGAELWVRQAQTLQKLRFI